MEAYRPDASVLITLIPVFIFCIVLVLYPLAVIRQYLTRGYWSLWRTASFLAGMTLLGTALTPPLVNLAHHDIRAHMAQHLLIGMLAPLALVLSAPLTLMLRSLPVKMSRWLIRLLHGEFFVWLTHPFTAFGLNIGGMYLLYLTPIFSLSMTNAGVHYLMHVHFFLAGYLFTWVIAGPDPAPRRPSFKLRLGVLFLAMAAHAILSKLMYVHLLPADTPFTSDAIRSAAQWMYYGGDFAEVLLAIALFYHWYQQRSRQTFLRSYLRADNQLALRHSA